MICLIIYKWSLMNVIIIWFTLVERCIISILVWSIPVVGFLWELDFSNWSPQNNLNVVKTPLTLTPEEDSRLHTKRGALGTIVLLMCLCTLYRENRVVMYPCVRCIHFSLFLQFFYKIYELFRHYVLFFFFSSSYISVLLTVLAQCAICL
jgi:hypothetical protein